MQVKVTVSPRLAVAPPAKGAVVLMTMELLANWALGSFVPKDKALR